MNNSLILSIESHGYSIWKWSTSWRAPWPLGRYSVMLAAQGCTGLSADSTAEGICFWSSEFKSKTQDILPWWKSADPSKRFRAGDVQAWTLVARPVSVFISLTESGSHVPVREKVMKIAKTVRCFGQRQDRGRWCHGGLLQSPWRVVARCRPHGGRIGCGLSRESMQKGDG